MVATARNAAFESGLVPVHAQGSVKVKKEGFVSHHMQ